MSSREDTRRSMSVKHFARLTLAAATLALAGPAQAALEPNKPIKFVVPAGTGGGADQMVFTRERGHRHNQPFGA